MLVSLLVATALLSQSPVSNAHIHKPAAKTSLHFTLTMPQIPSFQADTLTVTRKRQLIPLIATMTLDSREEEAREEDDLVAAINTERTSRGLDALVSDPLLVEAARAHSREMCDLDYFDHCSPTHGATTPVDRYLDELHASGERRPSAAMVGENIFFASVTNAVYNAGYAHQSLMASLPHRENILQPRFTKVGVGLYRDPQGRFWVTEMFLRDN
ncbi:MAG: CAP domain-containing protein [Janthinobacterium lividum]